MGRLIHYKNGVFVNHKNQLIHELVNQQHPEIRAELVPEVNAFIKDYCIPLFPRTSDTNDDVYEAIDTAKNFSFKANDPHDRLTTSICDVILFHLQDNLLPNSEKARNTILNGLGPLVGYDDCDCDDDYY